MRVQEYREKLNQVLEMALLLKKQINALYLISAQYIIEKSGIDEECRCTYDLPELWGEYAYKIQKCVYFLEPYCRKILEELDCKNIMIQEDDIQMGAGSYLKEAIFNFDAFVLSASTIIDYETRDYLAEQLKQNNQTTTSDFPGRPSRKLCKPAK